jgi:DNA-binding transcriptional LysR family regulator
VDIRNLSQVLAIRKYGSFAKAAEALGVSQPNLSKSIARLEDRLKLKLFDRTAKGSRLTPVGELIVDRADAVIAETRNLARDAALLAGGETGIVRIGFSSSVWTAFATPLLQWIVSRHPNLMIHAEVAPAARLLPLLDSRDLDVIFVAQPPPPSETAYVAEAVLEAVSVFVASPSHPLAKERDISIERLAQFKCGGALSPSSSNAKRLGFESENLGIYTASHYDLLLPLVVRGDLALFAPSFVVRPHLQTGELVILDLEWRYDQAYHVVTTRGASYSPIVREIREQARVIGRQLRDEWGALTGRYDET